MGSVQDNQLFNYKIIYKIVPISAVPKIILMGFREFKDQLEAMGVVRGKNSLQIIYGVRVQNITTKIKDILNLD